MNEVEVDLLSSQWEAVTSDAQALFYMGGNGCGKTEAIAAFIYAEAVQYPNNYICLAGPSLPQLRRAALIKVPEAFARFGLREGVDWRFNKNTMEFVFPANGSRIFLIGVEHLNENEIEGSEVGALAIDEIAGISFRKYQALASRVRKPNTSRKIRLFGYPPSPSHWTYERFEQNSFEGDKLIQASTHENLQRNGGYLPDDYLDNLEKTYRIGSPLHTRKVLGRWAQMEGLVYPEFSRALEVDDAPEAHHFVCGLDFGYKNPTVFLTAAVDGGDPATNTIYIIAEHYAAGLLYEQHVEAIQRIYPRAGARVFADHDAQGQKELQSLGIPTMNAQKGVIFGIDAVRDRLASGRLKFLRGQCPNLLREFGLYCYPDDSGRGAEKADLPLKRDDHAMDALRYLVVGEDYSRQASFTIRAG